VLCPRAFCLLASGLERAVHTVEGAARTEYVPGEPYRVKSEEARSFCNCRSSLRRRNCRYSSPAPNFAFGGHIPIPTTSQRDDVDKQFSRLHRHWRPKQHSMRGTGTTTLTPSDEQLAGPQHSAATAVLETNELLHHVLLRLPFEFRIRIRRVYKT
jgi:hypothetical protein